ncbi:ATP-binding protein [Listeria booriae]|uniref:AAA family ATPase n=1 Tax=Listeria booriae TaxID=1552123 RepID=UPI0016255F07|nr:ATP-binding protein [Listeria booriae]MBC1919408.1 ATP-binding protein [Listeria booriae]MBC2067012.1 ATP-binding protein [Listeria booriae]
MLIKFEVEDFKLFDTLSFSMKANNRLKHLKENIVEARQVNALKTAVIFGPNNSGKSTFIDAIRLMKSIVLENELEGAAILPSFAKGDPVFTIKFAITFLIEENIFEYGMTISLAGEQKNTFKDEYLKSNNKLMFEQVNNKISVSDDNRAGMDILRVFADIFKAGHTLFLPFVCDSNNDDLGDILKVHEHFKKIKIIDADYNNNAEKSIKLLEDSETKFVNDLVKHGDLSLSEIEFNRETFDRIDVMDDSDLDAEFMKKMCLQSVHSYGSYKTKFPFILTESLGTLRLFSLAGEIYSAIKNDEILIIDEIDNSFHTILTRNIFNMFNMYDGTRGQLIATTHDILLLENKFLFRRDQIWFTQKNDGKGYLYSLNEFSSKEKSTGVRSGKSSILSKYLDGYFGALPNIDIISVIDALEREGD